MPFLLEAPALCRSYGLIPVFVTQSYEQIRKYYGEDDLGIIRANAGYQTIFRMNTEKDAKEISDLIGDFTREKTSSSKGTFDFFKSNNTVSKEGYKLITSQYIKNQSREDILILVTGFLSRPIKAKVPYWFNNPKFKGADKISLEDNNTNTKGESKNTKGESKNDEINNDDSQNVNQEQNFTQENSSSKQIFELEELGIKVKKE